MAFSRIKIFDFKGSSNLSREFTLELLYLVFESFCRSVDQVGEYIHTELVSTEPHDRCLNEITLSKL